MLHDSNPQGRELLCLSGEVVGLGVCNTKLGGSGAVQTLLGGWPYVSSGQIPRAPYGHRDAVSKE